MLNTGNTIPSWNDLPYLFVHLNLICRVANEEKICHTSLVSRKGRSIRQALTTAMRQRTLSIITVLLRFFENDWKTRRTQPNTVLPPIHASQAAPRFKLCKKEKKTSWKNSNALCRTIKKKERKNQSKGASPSELWRYNPFTLVFCALSSSSFPPPSKSPHRSALSQPFQFPSSDHRIWDLV